MQWLLKYGISMLQYEKVHEQLYIIVFKLNNRENIYKYLPMWPPLASTTILTRLRKESIDLPVTCCGIASHSRSIAILSSPMLPLFSSHILLSF